MSVETSKKKTQSLPNNKANRRKKRPEVYECESLGFSYIQYIHHYTIICKCIWYYCVCSCQKQYEKQKLIQIGPDKKIYIRTTKGHCSKC